jgi:hypothetical protein
MVKKYMAQLKAVEWEGLATMIRKSKHTAELLLHGSYGSHLPQFGS